LIFITPTACSKSFSHKSFLELFSGFKVFVPGKWGLKGTLERIEASTGTLYRNNYLDGSQGKVRYPFVNPKFEKPDRLINNPEALEI